MVIYEDDNSFYLATFREGGLLVESSGEVKTIISTMERNLGNFPKSYIDLKVCENLNQYNSLFVMDFVESYPIEKENKKDIISVLVFFSFTIDSQDLKVTQYHKLESGRVHASQEWFGCVNDLGVSDDGHKKTISEAMTEYIELMEESGIKIKFIKVDKYTLNITAP